MRTPPNPAITMGKPTNTITVGAQNCNYTDLNVAITAVKTGNVSIANPYLITLASGSFIAPVGGFDLAGVKGLTIKGSGANATYIFPNPADVYSDNFVFNFTTTTEKCDIYDVHVDLTLGGTGANYYGGCVFYEGVFNTFWNCKFSWTYGCGIVGGTHEGGFVNCDYIALVQYATNDLCISAGDEAWTAGTNVTFSNDTTDKIHYDASAVFTVTGAGVANNGAIGTIVPSYNPFEGQTQSLWIKPNWGVSAGALKLKLGTATGAGNTGNIATFTLPALSANVWTRIQYNAAGGWSGAIAEVKLENSSGGTLAAGNVIKINDYWLERLRYKTNKIFAFGGNTKFMHVINCRFAVRQYIADPKTAQNKTLIGIADIGTNNDFYKHITTSHVYTNSISAGCNIIVNGGRIHHTVKRYGHCEVFNVHDYTTLTLGDVPTTIWADMSPDPDGSEGATVNGTEHTLRVICARHEAIVGATIPTLAIRDYGVLQLDAKTHTLDYASTKALSLSGTALVYNTADLPAATLTKGAVISDVEAAKLKVSDGANWIAQV
jgi:hypothetical protein